MVNIPLDLKLGEIKTDLERYQYGALAGRLMQSEEGQKYLPGALEQLASDMSVDEGFVQAAMASEKGIQMLAATYGNKYNEAMGKLNVQDLYNIHKGSIESYLGKEDFEKIDKKYNSDERSIGDLSKKIAGLQHDMNHPTNEKIREKAKKEMEKYQYFVMLLNLHQDKLYEKLISKAGENTRKMNFQNMAKAA